MDLYFSPLACSLASRIALYEAGLPATYHRISKARTTPDGQDFLSINSRGQVPALRIEGGEVLTENVSVLEYIADLKPEAGLAPQGIERVRMRKWLALVNSELHTVLGPLLASGTPDAMKTHMAGEAVKVLGWLDGQLAGRTWLLESFSVADIYLAVVVNWTQALPIDMKAFPNIVALKARVFARPAAARALGEEVELYRTAA